MKRVPLIGSFRRQRMLIVGLIAVAACTDNAPTALSPTEIGLAAARLAAGNGPTVKSTDPDTATIDTTLNVRVFGSGYDQGSRAQWAFKGVVSDKVVTNSTQFVSSTELVANITIARNANLGSHDVIVTTAAGKPGIGTELFVVTMKMTQLPSLGGVYAEAYAINDAGHAVGWSTDSIGYSRAVRWTNAGGIWTVRMIDPQATREAARALAISEQGTAVGDTEGRAKAVVWRIDGSKAVIGQQWSKATAINNYDVIVGSIMPADVLTPAVWTPSGLEWTARLLEMLPGVTRGSCVPGEALGISDENVIVGFVNDGGCAQIPVMWRPTADGFGWLSAERLSSIGTMAQGVAQGIVGSTIVGWGYPCALLAGCTRRAFRWTVDGTSGPLGNLDARANNLNRAGYIAGSYIRKGGHMTSVVWLPTTSAVVLLPTPGLTGDNWAWDINDASPRQAVGGVRKTTGGRDALLWTIP